VTASPASSRTAAPGTDAKAWYLPVADPRAWLEEVCSWNVPLAALRLLLVPGSSDDRRACGALVILNGDDPESKTAFSRVRPSALAEPYICLARRLYIPRATELHPPMSDEELRRSMHLDVQVLHPSIGLVGANDEELVRVDDLIEPPDAPAAIDWGDAIPSEWVDPHIRSVQPTAVPRNEQFIEESGEGIGGADPTALAPLPQESPLGRAAAVGSIAILSALEWLAKHLGGGGGAPAGRAGATGKGAVGKPATDNWLQQIRGWSADKLAALRGALADARAREMARLLKLLESDPDEGLRFALPLAGGAASRGVAPPSWRLGKRSTEFNLKSISSSGPADAWEAPWEVHQRLLERYRALANRELALGRYRRAAYIFGKLLDDVHAAANALKQGKFYREAAVLYRDRLNDARSAAQCLEDGGLVAEAIPLYESLGNFEKVGDLHRRLEQETEAQAAYRRAVHEATIRGDQLGAARLLETKLCAPDEALRLLVDAWPDAP
jgi:hypothetical protein